MAQNSLRTNSLISGRATSKLSVVRSRHEEINVDSIIDEQFPEFVRTEYPRMVDFARSYYEYIAGFTEIGEIDDIKDIDLTSGDYLLKLRREFSYNAAKFNYLSDKEFIRHAKEFYASKGTEESIKFLFRVMFSEEIEIESPSERIFKPSSANWYQLQSVKIKISNTSLDATEFIGSYVNIRNSVGIKQQIEIEEVTNLGNKTFELFFATELYINVSVGDLVIADNLDGTIIPSLSSVKVVDAGKGFRIGQVVNLDSVSGNGGVGIITRVGTSGQVKGVKILRFGSGYSTNFYIGVEPIGVFTDSGTSVATTGTSTYNIALTDLQENYAESMDSFISDYTLNNSSSGRTPFYVNTFNSYVGTFISSFRGKQTYYSEKKSNCLLLCITGAVCKYPGTFIDKAGAVSDYSVLQDNNYYQSFSYAIKSKSDISTYKDIVTSFVHPAGMKMIGDRSVEDYFYNIPSIGSSEVMVIPLFDVGYLRALIPVKVRARASTAIRYDLDSDYGNTKITARMTGYLKQNNNLSSTTSTIQAFTNASITPLLFASSINISMSVSGKLTKLV